MRIYGLLAPTCYGAELEAYNPAFMPAPAWPSPWYTPQGYAQAGDALTFGYEPYGMTASHVDRFYISSYPMTTNPADASYYETVGTLFQTVNYSGSLPSIITTDGAVTLEPDTGYFVLAVRFDGATVVESFLEYGRTLKQSFALTPANTTLQADWTQADFNAWFHLAFGAGAGRLSIAPSNDVPMGDFVRLSGRDNPFYVEYIPQSMVIYSDAAWDCILSHTSTALNAPGTPGGAPYWASRAWDDDYPDWGADEAYNDGTGYNNGSAQNSGWHNHFVGKKYLSPRYDWEISLPIRIKTGAGQQFAFGFSSGDQQNIHLETHLHHPSDGFEDVDTDTFLRGTSTGILDFTLWATCRNNEADRSAGTEDTRAWRVAPVGTSPAWTIVDDQVFTLKFAYAASTKTVTVYKDATLICTFSPTGPHQPPYLRVRDDEHYPLPITPYFAFKEMIPGSGGYVDIGAVQMTTACPYDYVGYAVNTNAMIEAGYEGPSDGEGGYILWDGTKNTLAANSIVPYRNYTIPHRYTADTPSGLTVAPVGWNPYDLMHAQSQPFAEQTKTARLLPILIPDDRMIAAYTFQGLPNKGTAKARLTTGEFNLTTPVDITDWKSTSLVTSAIDIREIQPEIEIYSEAFTPATAEERPSLFVGFEFYLSERESGMASSLSDRYKARVVALHATSTTRYKATFHNGASRPVASTAVYAATGLGELSTTTNYTTGGVGLTGGVQLNATLTGDNLTFADVTITSAIGETIGPVDTIAVWDTSDTNGLLFIVDLQAATKTAAEGGAFTQDFPAVTLAVVRSVA